MQESLRREGLRRQYRLLRASGMAPSYKLHLDHIIPIDVSLMLIEIHAYDERQVRENVSRLIFVMLQ